VSDNPYIYVADSKTWNTVEKININNYIKDGALDMTVLKNTIDWIKTRIDNLEKTIKILRKEKSYLLKGLYLQKILI
jgi:DNA-binding beta-propeller fold protein YncE